MLAYSAEIKGETRGRTMIAGRTGSLSTRRFLPSTYFLSFCFGQIKKKKVHHLHTNLQSHFLCVSIKSIIARYLQNSLDLLAVTLVRS